MIGVDTIIICQNGCTNANNFPVVRMILQSIFNPLKKEISVKLGEEEARFKYGQMCCSNWLNISSVSELFLPVWFSIKL